MTVTILIGDVRARLAELPAASVDCVVTSPPYWGLRDYGVEGQIGMEPNTRNLRNYEPAPLPVWNVPTSAFKEAHFATFPPELVERCLKAGCPPKGTVLDPFGGAGTTGLVADRIGLDCTLIELNAGYAEIARKRIAAEQGMFTACEVTAPAPEKPSDGLFGDRAA